MRINKCKCGASSFTRWYVMIEGERFVARCSSCARSMSTYHDLFVAIGVWNKFNPAPTKPLKPGWSYSDLMDKASSLVSGVEYDEALIRSELHDLTGKDQSDDT